MRTYHYVCVYVHNYAVYHKIVIGFLKLWQIWWFIININSPIFYTAKFTYLLITVLYKCYTCFKMNGTVNECYQMKMSTSSVAPLIICDCLSKNQPSFHFPILRNTIFKHSIFITIAVVYIKPHLYTISVCIKSLTFIHLTLKIHEGWFSQLLSRFFEVDTNFRMSIAWGWWGGVGGG